MYRLFAAAPVGLGVALLGLSGWSGGAETGVATEARAVAGSAAPEWQVDNVHSSVLFKIRHGGGTTNFYGRFNNFSGDVEFDLESMALEAVNFEVDINSIDTNAVGRDSHLRQGDFFNARQFPKATFKSAGVRKGSGDTWKLVGDLTMVGQTKRIEAEVYDVRRGEFRNATRVGFEAKFTIKRTDFGMNTYVADDGGETGPLGNTVEIIVAIQAFQP